MIVTLDLSRLLKDGNITQDEHDRLLALGTTATGSLVFNILIAFGVVAVAAGIIVLVPTPSAGIVIGGSLLIGGLAAYAAGLKQWEVLANICVLVGALVLGGGIVVLSEASITAFLAIAVGFAVVGAIARSGLLVCLAVLSVSSALGARTGYWHATYFLGIEEPALTVVLFSGLALATFVLSKTLPAAHERLAILAARTSIFLVNFGFWIGSLWGDRIGHSGPHIFEYVFVAGWAVGLIALGAWAARRGRLWVINVVAVFAAIHFYTQWFEHLGAQPASVLIAGLIAIAVALGLRHLNRGPLSLSSASQ